MLRHGTALCICTMHTKTKGKTAHREQAATVYTHPIMQTSYSKVWEWSLEANRYISDSIDPRSEYYLALDVAVATFVSAALLRLFCLSHMHHWQ
jgi:hypothetical protein